MHRLCLHLYFRQGEVLFAGQREDGCKAQIASIWIYPSFFPILLYHDKVLQVWSTPWVAHKHKEIQEPCVSTGVSQWKKWQSMFKSFGCYGNGKYFLAWIPWFSSRLRIFWRSQRNITSSHCYSITQYIEVFLKKVISLLIENQRSVVHIYRTKGASTTAEMYELRWEYANS